jgi:hypothetical protein
MGDAAHAVDAKRQLAMNAHTRDLGLRAARNDDFSDFINAPNQSFFN